MQTQQEINNTAVGYNAMQIQTTGLVILLLDLMLDATNNWRNNNCA